MKTKFIPLVALLLSSAFLPSCSKGTNALKVWCPNKTQYIEVFKSAIERYQADNPNEQIELESNNIDDVVALRTKINDSKSCPDVAICDHIYVSPLAANGLLTDLTDLDAGTIKNSVPQGIYDACTYQNNLYSLPYTANTVVLWGNKAWLEEANITKMPETIDELKTDLTALKSVNCPAPLLMPVRNKSYSSLILTSYIAKRGGSICSDDFKTMTLTSDETLKALYDWFDLSKYLTNKSYLTSYQEDAFYTRGDAAFIEMGSWNISKITMKEGMEVLYSPVVAHDENIPNYSGLGLYNFVIPKKSSESERAFKFAKFLSTDYQFQLDYAKVEKLLPVTNEALKDEFFTKDPILNVYAKQLQTVVARPGHPCWEQISGYMDDLIYSIMNECENYNQVKARARETNMDLQEIVNQFYYI